VQDNGNFSKYPKMEIPQIIDYLKEHKNEYDIVYISGDTDSFAPPRTEEGLTLLRSIAEAIDTDITFTTKAVFSKEQLDKLQYISVY
jgi:DNA repair photolyase